MASRVLRFRREGMSLSDKRAIRQPSDHVTQGATMRKMKLDLETLAVESFGTAGDASVGGTVNAYDAPTPPFASCGCTTGASYIARLCPPPPAVM
jgi:hypothetical protein